MENRYHNSSSSVQHRFKSSMEKGLCNEEEEDYYLHDDKREEYQPVKEVAKAMKLMGDGFVRMEQNKMQIVKEMETMRIQMEMKRTQLLLDSQERVMDAIAKAISKKKHKKKKKEKKKNNNN